MPLFGRALPWDRGAAQPDFVSPSQESRRPLAAGTIPQLHVFMSLIGFQLLISIFPRRTAATPIRLPRSISPG